MWNSGKFNNSDRLHHANIAADGLGNKQAQSRFLNFLGAFKNKSYTPT